MTKPKIKKLKLPSPVIECWAVKIDGYWMVTNENERYKNWGSWGWKGIPGTFIPHKEGKHG